MTRSLSVSETGLRLIKAFEGFRPVDRELVTGARVVGYGHRVFSQTPIRMTEEQAEETLKLDLEAYEELINEEVHAPLTQSQFDALVSLAFNIGPRAFRESDILRALNNGRPLDAAAAFDVWRKATIDGKTYVVDALMRRRTAEKALFLRTEGVIPAPSALLEPKADWDTGLGPIDDGLPVFTQDDAAGIIARAPYEAAPHPDDRIDDADDAMDEDEDDDVLVLSEVIEAEPEPEPESEEDPFEFSDLAGLMAITPVPESKDTLADDDVEALAEDPIVDEDEEYRGDDDHDDEDGDGGASTSEVTEEIPVTLEDDDLELVARDVEDDVIESPISEAADSLGERLSALLDSEDDETLSDPVDLPASLLDAPEETKRSNLVTFPSRQLADRTSVDLTSEAELSDNADDIEGTNTTNPIVIDNLAADDVIRASREPKDIIYDPDGDPVEAATRYLERTGVVLDEDRRGGGMWIPLALGSILIGVSAVLLGRGATNLLNAWGPASVIAASVTGGLMILFTLYAAARGRFA
ncbi:MAG: lysozyme [Pseudomonadota bacterium]